LKLKKAKKIGDGSIVSLIPHDRTDWLLIQSKKGLILTDIEGKLIKNLGSQDNFKLNEQKTAIALLKSDTLSFFIIPKLKLEVISICGKYSALTFSHDGRKLGYFRDMDKNTQLCVYDMDSTAVLTTSDRLMSKGMQFGDDILSFSPEDNFIYFYIKSQSKVRHRDADLITTDVTIWSYKDVRLPSGKIENPKDQVFAAVIPITSNSPFVQLETESSKLKSFGSGNKYVLTRNVVNQAESYYRPELREFCQLIDISSGKIIRDSLDFSATLSPSERFITWSNATTGKLFFYEITSKKLCTNAIADGGNPYVAGWESNDDMCYVFDKYDLWRFDPKGNVKATNVTNGYGRKNGISFNFAGEISLNAVVDRGKRLLSAVDTETMANGYFVVDLNHLVNPHECFMDARLYELNIVGAPPVIRKAKHADKFVMTGQTASEAPNLFVTDLKWRKQVSTVAPQKPYNWLKSELINYSLNNGKNNKAILYKPENFDAQKKYPIIFYYYQGLSSELNRFRSPQLLGGIINIPWFVSNGYLVCVPDIINDKPGYITETTVDAVVSAAKFLMKYPWVNSQKMGIQGHSFGGYETNILVANTNIFAAAQASAGFSNAISDFGDVRFGNAPMSQHWEKGQMNFQVSLWDNPELYVNNSPVLKADKITTPLLLEYGIYDENLFRQGREMFNALRRLQKPAWLLQYTENHILQKQENILDYNIRQQQFFNHYLKGDPAPVWMTNGVSDGDREFISGLKYETIKR